MLSGVEHKKFYNLGTAHFHWEYFGQPRMQSFFMQTAKTSLELTRLRPYRLRLIFIQTNVTRLLFPKHFQNR